MSKYVWQNPYETGDFHHGAMIPASWRYAGGGMWADQPGLSVPSVLRGGAVADSSYNFVTLQGSGGGWDENYNVQTVHAATNADDYNSSVTGLDVVSGGGEVLTDRIRVQMHYVISSQALFGNLSFIWSSCRGWDGNESVLSTLATDVTSAGFTAVRNSDDYNPWGYVGGIYWAELHTDIEYTFNAQAEFFAVHQEIEGSGNDDYAPAFDQAWMTTWETSDLEMAVLLGRRRLWQI